MQSIQDFVANYWVHLAIVGVVTISVPRIINWIHDSLHANLIAKLEEARTDLNHNPVFAQLKIDDAIIDILESYIPEVLHELEETAKDELAKGSFAALDWKNLGASLWAKARAELEAGTIDYIKTSGEKDGEALATLIARKYVMREAAIKRGIISPK